MSEKKCSNCGLLQPAFRKWCRDCGTLFPEETLSSIWDEPANSGNEDQTEHFPLEQTVEPASETIYGVPVAGLRQPDAPIPMLVPETEVDESEAPTELWTRPTKPE